VPSEKRFAGIRRLLERDGWTLERIRGSHHTFKKPGSRNILIPVHGGKVKPFYVKEVEKIIQGRPPTF
jgi:predicted RNA binding protein YcfA (HicA-like mRNA interferase family)